MKRLLKILLSSVLATFVLLWLCQLPATAQNASTTSKNGNASINTNTSTSTYISTYISTSTKSSTYSDSIGIKTALLIVDIQNFYFPGEGPGLVNAEAASLVAKEVLQSFRDKGQLVVHVRHKSSKGFEIHKNVEPLANEKVITKTEVNSFKGTDLLEYLQANNVKRLVIIGMQTQMCLEAAVRAARDYGFECIVVADACATKDLKFGDKIVKAEDVQTAVFATLKDGRYAKVVNFDESFSAKVFQKYFDK